MQAGRELDALIAVQVFGYTLDYEFADLNFGGAPCVKELRDQYDEWGILPCYSTEMGDAWQIVEHLRMGGAFFDLGDKPRDPDDLGSPRVWNAFINRTMRGPDADTAPHAICLAALKAHDVPLAEEVASVQGSP